MANAVLCVASYVGLRWVKTVAFIGLMIIVMFML